MRLLLVRHGQTAWNAEQRYQGQIDIPLDDIGRRQAAAVGERLRHERIDIVYASDLARAHDTAAAIIAHHDLTIQPEIRLRELGFGVWEGLTRAEIAAQHAESWQAYQTDPHNTVIDGAEGMPRGLARVGAAMDDLLARHRDQPDVDTLLIVSHGGTLRLMVAHLLGLDIEHARLFRFANCSLTEITIGEQRTYLVTANERCHLRKT